MGVTKTEVIVTVHPSFKANRAARLRDWRRSASMRVLPLEATGHPRQAPELAAGIRSGYLVSLCEPSEGPKTCKGATNFARFPEPKVTRRIRQNACTAELAGDG